MAGYMGRCRGVGIDLSWQVGGIWWESSRPGGRWVHRKRHGMRGALLGCLHGSPSSQAPEPFPALEGAYIPFRGALHGRDTCSLDLILQAPPLILQASLGLRRLALRGLQKFLEQRLLFRH